ncbi:MAG: hypothetical protein LBE11_05790 [Prevotellaceae bacterium]|jgi:hypothetical protein|nr:hypothetical protein [Prevotellaceae bacterium]
MEQIKKYFKLIAGVLIIIFCLLPFIGGISGFGLFSKDVLGILAIVITLLGAAVLIVVSFIKDIEVLPKFNLSRLAKLAVIVGIVLTFAELLAQIGAGLVLIILVTIVLFYEDKIIAAIKKTD